MHKAIIIDDEEMARALLDGMIKEFCPDVHVVELCKDLPSGIKAIRKHKPSIVFLDIEMPGHSGLELMDFFNEEEIDFSIIFVTAYNRYAIQAFKLSAVDYLLKPIEVEDLQNAVRLAEKAQAKNKFQVLKDNLNQKPSKIAIHTVSAINFIDLNDILFMKADGSYTEVVLKNDTKVIASKSLKHFENILQNQSNFYRCHKSYIVNIDYITEYIKTDGGSLKISQYHIGVSPDKITTLLQMLSF